MALNARSLVTKRAAWTGGTAAAPSKTPAARRSPVDPSSLTDEELDGILMLALDEAGTDIPGLDDCLTRNEQVFAAPAQPSSAQLEGFMRVVEQRGLVKQERPLTWREYLGALLPSR